MEEETIASQLGWGCGRVEGAAADGCLKVVWNLPPFKAKSVKLGCNFSIEFILRIIYTF